MTNTMIAAPDDTAVRAVLDGVYAAWAANDSDAFVADYAEDATAILPSCYLPNREAVRAGMAAGFAGPLAGTRVVHTVEQVRFLGADVAVLLSESGVVAAGETAPPAGGGTRDTWVLSRRDGAWRVELFHSCPRDAG
ncbi:MAG TPA: SgcJ/EcaC family oxidoreductase [Pseudonocardia sp.]|nr:SgcJ/EcaC family oxidoreductase [Pseudonocardia sp.]